MDVIIKIVSNNIFPPEGKILVEFLIEKLSENTHILTPIELSELGITLNKKEIDLDITSDVYFTVDPFGNSFQISFSYIENKGILSVYLLLN